MSEPNILKSEVRTRFDEKSSRTVKHSAVFRFNVGTLNDISKEFGVPKTNEKASTISKGCAATANPEIAKQLVGKRFLVDTSGREIPPCIGYFDDTTIDVANSFAPTYDNELFITDLTGPAYEATKFKLLLKAIALYGKLLHANAKDDKLMTFEIMSEPVGGGLIEALFASGASEVPIDISITEITNFKLMEQEHDEVSPA